ncbi:DUF1833 family protein [Xanthobacter tagetidis]|uniref:DUF1833 domain-containing protein n=1 Tax=Xanthobacter tagetidis TaxID=60216 RepID=A0A3L7AH41_9HYPH|nr:DUF1833 family protein [Xanthobacter tagetidis]MBB6306214.1 hypothetical protein [Xanthobacter tagetidis]RLP79497.1 DUF1833 domain-containing protein [Xanthobacter tagetidis]
MSDWDDAWAEAEASTDPAVMVFDTLELQHPAFIESEAVIPLRFVCDVEPRTLTIEDGATFNGGEAVVFQPIAFEASMPEFAEQRIPEVRVAVDNVARELMPYLEAAVVVRADLKVLVRQYREDDTSEPVYGPVEFVIRKVTVSGTRVEGMARLEDLTNMKFPSRVYKRSEFSALMVG